MRSYEFKNIWIDDIEIKYFTVDQDSIKKEVELKLFKEFEKLEHSSFAGVKIIDIDHIKLLEDNKCLMMVKFKFLYYSELT